MNKRDIDAFVHDIQLMIPVSDDNSKRFLKDMCSSISDYVSAHEKCTLDEIIGEFHEDELVQVLLEVSADSVLTELDIHCSSNCSCCSDYIYGIPLSWIYRI